MNPEAHGASPANAGEPVGTFEITNVDNVDPDQLTQATNRMQRMDVI